MESNPVKEVKGFGVKSNIYIFIITILSNMSILNKIEDSFKGMVTIGKVDTSITTYLKEFRDVLIRSKNQFSGKKDVFNDFPIFHALETQIRVINQMIYRIELAPKIHDNPQVADDALFVLPQLRLVNDSITNKMKSDNHYIMGISSRLQILSMKNNMYPPQEKVLQSISKTNLEDNFNRFVSRVGEEIERV